MTLGRSSARAVSRNVSTSREADVVARTSVLRLFRLRSPDDSARCRPAFAGNAAVPLRAWVGVGSLGRDVGLTYTGWEGSEYLVPRTIPTQPMTISPIPEVLDELR